MWPSFFLVSCFFSASLFAFAKEVSGTCLSGEHWVRPHHRSAYIRANGTPVSASNVIGHCQRNPIGFDYWNPKKKSGLPPNWEHVTEKPKGWTTEEWERVVEALSDLPEVLWIPTIKGLYRLEKSVFYPNPASGEPSSIALYDSAFSSKEKLAQILAHELAHELYRNLGDAGRKSYMTATQWFEQRIGNKTYTVKGRSDSQFIESDGMNSPAEDFSNNIEAFLLNPKNLERVSPSAYKWIQQQFGDKLKLRPGGK